MNGLMQLKPGLVIVSIECLDIIQKVYLNVNNILVNHLQQHVKEDCNNYIPTAKEWVDNIEKPVKWMIKTLKIED
jgi:hypothetical protein